MRTLCGRFKVYTKDKFLLLNATTFILMAIAIAFLTAVIYHLTNENPITLGIAASVGIVGILGILIFVGEANNELIPAKELAELPSNLKAYAQEHLNAGEAEPLRWTHVHQWSELEDGKDYENRLLDARAATLAEQRNAIAAHSAVAD